MSYQPNVLTSDSSSLTGITMVSPASKMHEAGEPTMSLDTIGSSVYSSTRSSGGLAAASAKAALTSTTDGFPFTTAVKSVMEPAGSGTRNDLPSSRPFIASSTRLVARAAPVELGTMLTAPARARRRSVCVRSSRFWSFVYACTVVMSPLTMSKASSTTLTMGTKQLVVHDAFDTTTCFSGSNSSSLTPITKVASASPDGAEMTTRFTDPPRWPAASARVVKRPVDSMTTSAPSLSHGSCSGSRSARTRICWSPTSRSLPSTSTGTGNRPCVES